MNIKFTFVSLYLILSFSMICGTKLAGKKLRILVFGGTGYVGSTFIAKAVNRGHEVVAISRRGLPALTSNAGAQLLKDSNKVKWLKGDARNYSEVKTLLKEESSTFDVCVHAVGLLFDSSSGLSSFNKVASGSASIPSSDATYDSVTRVTAFNAIDYMLSSSVKMGKTPPSFIFVSAAEAGWDFPAPVEFLERYLIAKRAVEARLDPLVTPKLRSTIFRPSLIWDWKKLDVLIPVLAFYIANALGVSFVDRPVTVDSLTDAMLAAAENSSITGIKRYSQIETLKNNI